MPVVTIPALGQYGLVADQPAQELPPNGISRMENIRCRDGLAERFSGHSSIFTAPSITPYYIAPYGTATARYWIHSGIVSTYADDGTTRTNITKGAGLTGAIDDRFTGGALHGLYIQNNGVDVPKYWDGNTANDLETLTAWDANWRVKWVRPFKNYLVYGFPTKSGTAYPHTVGWSAAADPGTLPTTYDPASTTTDAGDVPLGETPDQLVDGLPLGEIFIVYKERSCYRMEYVGGQQIFSFKRLPGNVGALARGCIASTPKGHVVLTNGDVVLVDGFGEPQSLLTGRLKRWLRAQIDSTYYARSFVFANEEKNEVWICYPYLSQTTCTKALVWNWVDNTFSRRDLPNVTYAASGLLYYPAGLTMDALTGTTDSLEGFIDANDYTPADSRVIMASTAPALYLADTTSGFAGSAISSVIERTGLVFDDTDRVKCWRSMTPRINAAAGTVVYIQFGGSMTADTAPSWSDPVAFTVGTDFKAYGFATGRYLAYRIYSTGAQGWAVKSIDCDIKPMGIY